MNATSTFLCRHGIDPYIRGFRQSYFKHSDLGYFVDLRPIGSTVHLWTAFVGLVIIQQSIRLLSADFTELDRSKIEEQKKAVRSGYDMDISATRS